MSSQGEQREVELSPSELPPPPTKAERIAALTDKYKADIAVMQMSWLAAAVADGDVEEETKADIVQEIADRKSQYMADRAAILAGI